MALDQTILDRTRIVVFDAYGTLFDVHSAVARHAQALGPDAARLSEIWRAKQLEYSWVLSLAGHYEPFWRLTEQALDYAFARCPGADRNLREKLLAAYRSLEAYPDAAGALESVRNSGRATAILSNGDPRMLRDAVASAGLTHLLDEVLSIEAVGIFKTSRLTYDLVVQAFTARPSEVVFVSSNRWDVAGAAAFGFTPVWVNRLGLPDEYPAFAPQMVIENLSELL